MNKDRFSFITVSLRCLLVLGLLADVFSPLHATAVPLQQVGTVPSPVTTNAIVQALGAFRNAVAEYVPAHFLPSFSSGHGSGDHDFLETVRTNAEIAARLIRMPNRVLQAILKPQREYSFEISWRDDEGKTKTAQAWRIVHEKPSGFASKGGLRADEDASIDEVRALATGMSVKLMFSELGGAKGGIAVNPAGFSNGQYARMMRAYVNGANTEVYRLTDEPAFGNGKDVPAPDKGTSPRQYKHLMANAADQHIAWAVANGIQVLEGVTLPDELLSVRPDPLSDGTATPYVDKVLHLVDSGAHPELMVLLASFTGKSIEKGGSQGREDATGLGVTYALIEAMAADNLIDKDAALPLQGITVAVQGFGNVARGTVISCARFGAIVRAFTERDTLGAYAMTFEKGISVALYQELKDYFAEFDTLRGFESTPSGIEAGTELLADMNQFWSLKVDALAPSVGENFITPEVARLIQARYVVEGANGPTTLEGDQILNQRGIIVLPDVLANAGGVTVSNWEMVQNQFAERWSEEKIYAMLRDEIGRNFRTLLAIRQELNISFRTAAYVHWLRTTWRQRDESEYMAFSTARWPVLVPAIRVLKWVYQSALGLHMRHLVRWIQEPIWWVFNGFNMRSSDNVSSLAVFAAAVMRADPIRLFLAPSVIAEVSLPKGVRTQGPLEIKQSAPNILHTMNVERWTIRVRTLRALQIAILLNVFSIAVERYMPSVFLRSKASKYAA